MIGGTLSRICFVDPCAPRSYNGSPKSLAGLGGTEMTIVEIAKALARRAPVHVLQKARTQSSLRDGIRFEPFDMTATEGFDTIVTINSWKVAVSLARRHPDAEHFLWLHVFPGKHNRRMGSALRDAGVTVICVSQAHARYLRAFVDSAPEVTHIPNPIPSNLLPDDTPRRRNKLFFASAPHKGLRQTLEIFSEVRRTLPDLRLYVADPGYMHWPVGELPGGVIPMGRLDRTQVWRHMRESLCLFYPQNKFAETFGIVLAEANAVGCPVLVQRNLGANAEVVSSSEQCIDAFDTRTIIARLRSWQSDFPKISGRPAFRLPRVVSRWEALLMRQHTAHSLTHQLPAAFTYTQPEIPH